uniref:Uncharacterized protein n=1 Tax=Anopheles darlingi TaxID=43151 RepID=A0A2M4D3N9_ANODA
MLCGVVCYVVMCAVLWYGVMFTFSLSFRCRFAGLPVASQVRSRNANASFYQPMMMMLMVMLMSVSFGTFPFRDVTRESLLPACSV